MSASRKKSFSWYALFSPLGVLATSLVVMVSVWKVWWTPEIPKEVIDPTPYAMTYSDVGNSLLESAIGDSSTQSETTLVGGAVMSDDSIRATTTKTVSEDTPSPTTAEPRAKIAPLTTSTASIPVAETTSSDLDIRGDIASISSDIDSIIAESLTVDPLGEPSEPQTPPPPAVMMTANMAGATIITPTVTIPSYPTTLLVYAKYGAWTDTEQKSRSGSGITSTREKTISGEIMREKFGSIGSANVILEYHIGKKPNDSKIYLVPTLVSKEGRYFLIEGYSE